MDKKNLIENVFLIMFIQLLNLLFYFKDTELQILDSELVLEYRLFNFQIYDRKLKHTIFFNQYHLFIYVFTFILALDIYFFDLLTVL